MAFPKLKLGFKRWRNVKIMWAMIFIEAPLTIALLVLFGVADPDMYRDLLWLDGFENGFNSSPSQPIYNLVNGGSADVPLVWSPFITQYNVVIIVLSMFVLICKSIMIVLKWFPTLMSLVFHLVLIGLYAFSVHAQTAPDTIDPAHQNHGAPWYITHSCSVTKLKSNVGYCEQAKASFFLTIIIMALFIAYVVVAAQSILFCPDPPPDVDSDDEEEFRPSTSKGKEREPEEDFEMVPIPMTPGSAMFPMSPMTPRTKAFSSLEGASSSRRPMPAFPPPPTKEERKNRRKSGKSIS